MNDNKTRVMGPKESELYGKISDVIVGDKIHDLSDLRKASKIMGIVSNHLGDNFHSMEELYDYRMAYNAAFFKLLAQTNLPARVHKSKKHHDGEPCFNGKYFVVMAELPSGQISNHYKLKHWDLFDIPEQEVSDVWDGHDPEIALNRILDFCTETKMLTDFEEEVLITLNSDAEYCHNYKSLSHYLECGKEDLIPVIERFKELGFLEYYRGLMNDEGEVAGSGWCRSKKGNDYIEEHEL